MDSFSVLGIGGILVLATAITEFIMKITAGWFDKKRFGPLVSLASGIVASVLWQIFMPDTTMKMAVGRGFIIGFGGAGLFDNLKAGKNLLIKGGK